MLSICAMVIGWMQLRYIIISLLITVISISQTSAGEAPKAVSLLRSVAVNSKKLISPSIFGISSARTMGAYNGFAALAAASEPRSVQGGELEFDASGAVGLGVGNPQKTVGFDTYVGIISINPDAKDGGVGFAEDGNVSFKLGHTFLTDDFDSISLAAGVNNLIAWGAAKRINENLYGVASLGSAVELGDSILPVAVSLGAGLKQKDNTGFGIFAGLGVKLNYLVDVSAGYNASRWMTGLTFRFAQLGSSLLEHLVIQLGIDDVLDYNNNRRGVLIVALPFSL